MSTSYRLNSARKSKLSSLGDKSMNMDEGSKRRIDKKLSIETDPRALNVDQIERARKAALYVMKTRTIEEAMRIFTEGLEPVGRKSVPKTEKCMDCFEEQLDLLDDNDFHVEAFRHVATAPF